MEVSTYAVEAAIEESHWWFVARRRLLARLISESGVSQDTPILDLGTSTGTNFRMLNELGYKEYQGLDFSEEAIRWCAEKGLGKVQHGDVCNIPFAENSFGLILATDIIEHVEDDQKALSEITRVLKPGGTAIISVPAFQSLWGLQDEVSHHKRRYRLGPLKKLIGTAGLSCKECFYFNYMLFVPIWLTRRIIRLLKIHIQSENQVNTPMLNAILKAIFISDVFSARVINPPFGVSIICIAQKPTIEQVS